MRTEGELGVNCPFPREKRKLVERTKKIAVGKSRQDEMEGLRIY